MYMYVTFPKVQLSLDIVMRSGIISVLFMVIQAKYLSLPKCITQKRQLA